MRRSALFASVFSLVFACSESSTNSTPPTSIERKSPTTQNGVKVVKRNAKGSQRKRVAHTPQSLGIKMAKVPAGSFMMGACESKNCPKNKQKYKHVSKLYFDNAKSHTVTLTRSFLIATTELTEAQFQKVQDNYEANLDFPPWQPDPAATGPNLPFLFRSYKNAIRFLNELSANGGYEPCYTKDGKSKFGDIYACTGYRLPTEAEWEYAARAGTTGVTYGKIEEIAWTKKNSNEEVKPVGTKKPNAFGLFDMIGNAPELCHDWFDRDAYKSKNRTDPSGPTKRPQTNFGPSNRVLRGGAADGGSMRRLFELQYRSAHRTDFSGGTFGLRIVRTAP